MCPDCGSKKIWKDGHHYAPYGRIQRYVCPNCGHKFREKSLNKHNDPENVQRIHRIELNMPSSLFSNRQICVSKTKAAKNLVKVETQIKNQAVGATKLSNAEIKGKIVEYAWNLKRNGYAESTIKSYTCLIKIFVKRGADLNNPDSVKDVIAMQETWCKGRKNNAVKAYSLYVKMNDLTWKKPKYKPVEKLPLIPTEQEIDSLIGGCGKQMATFLQVLKETAARRGEALNLHWNEVDFVSHTIRITPEKGSRARIFRMSDELLRMLNNLPRTTKQVFTYKNEFYLDKGFRKMRKKIAHKLGNPRLLLIHFHTLRHWKATIEYAKTKDLLHVQKLLGHKSIKNTLRYVQLVDVPHEERFICKVAMNVKEASELIELGFEYVTGEYHDGGKIFRRRTLSYLGSSSISEGSWSSMD